MGNGSDKSTQALVEDTIAGNTEAFARLVDRYRDAASAVAYSYLGGFDDVQDAVQEAFVHAYCHLRQLREPAKFGPWLRRITANSCAMALRMRERSNVSLDEVAEQPSKSDDARGIAARAVVREALGKLSDAARLTVTLSYINGYSHAEIAEFLEVPITTVRGRLRHAKRKLREEMIEMVEDVLHEDKPDEALVEQIVKSVARFEQAWANEPLEDILGCIDTQLQTIDAMETAQHPEELQRQVIFAAERSFPEHIGQEAREKLDLAKSLSPEQFFRLARLDLFRSKIDAIKMTGREEEYSGMIEDCIRVLEESGDLEWKAEALRGRADQYCGEGKGDLAMDYYRRAADAFAEVNDKTGEAKSLWSLAHLLLLEKHKAAEARDLYARALPLWENSGCRADEVMCRAEIQCLEEVRERLDGLVEWSPSVVVLRRKGKTTELVGESCWGWGHADLPPVLRVGHIFTQIGWNTKFLDPSRRLGKSRRIKYNWDRGFAGTYVTITNRSNSEHVDVPAGSFDNCLLTEIEVEGNTRWRGTRRVWYASGVGIAQFQVQLANGAEGTMHLKEFVITQPSADYLPLAIGNSWAYGWVDAPQGYVAKEQYRVAANEGEHWYLENYRYVLKQTSPRSEASYPAAS